MSKNNDFIDGRLVDIKSPDDGYILLASVIVGGISDGLRSAFRSRDEYSIRYWVCVIKSSWYHTLTLGVVEPDDVIKTLAAQCGIELTSEDIAAY